MTDISANNSPGKDSIKGNIFFGSGLTPSGTFSNIPQITSLTPPSETETAKLVLTLQQVKEELQKNAASQAGATSDILSDAAVNTFLTSYIQLLIDYSDLRNYVFFGSAYTELSYHINYLIQNYPFKSYFAKDVGSGAVNPANTITLTYPGGNETEVSFEISNVLQPANYAFNNNGATNWLNFDLVDENGTRYPIVSAGFATSTLTVTAATNTSDINITISGNTSGLIDGDIVTISGVFGNTNANGTFVINNVITGANTSFDLVGSTGNGTYISGGSITLNKITLTVTGNISSNNFVEFIPGTGVLYKGLLISPKLEALADFQTLTDPIQTALLSPTNPTPWPRAEVTDNIVVSGSVFDTWATNPANMSSSYNEDSFGLVTDGDDEANVTLSLPSAFTLDDTITNQLIRRAIPHRLVDELRDTNDKFFTRFVLLAGKMFDTIKVYIDFLKYTKELNYTPFNQLSPQFYKVYAEHYGFDLFDDESVDLAKAVIRTEPGLSYDSQNNAVYDDPNTAKTVQELQNEKQKRLLINLFYLYSEKGTLKCIETLAKLLGSPEGLVVFEEQAYNQTTGKQIVDNEKIKVPQIAYEIDPDFLVNPNNVADPINLPYVYRLKLDNNHIVNLRQLDGYTDPQGAIQEQVLEFGKRTYAYGHFGNGSFANLQNNSSSNALGYYLLPLSFPDKYCGITVEYMLPRDGFVKGVGQNLDETTTHLGSLYEAYPITYTSNVPDFLSLTDSFAYQTPQVFMENIIGSTRATEIQGQPFIGNKQFIIARLEGKDLVIRCCLKSEVISGGLPAQRVAMLRNVFNTDGLNHELRLIYRPEGVEVYQDFKYLGLARWRNPATSSAGFKQAINCPKSVIESCVFAGLINLYAYPDNDGSNTIGTNAGTDSRRWWDLFIGLPVNVDMFFKRVAVQELPSINHPDTLDFGTDLSGFDVEKFSFNFENQVQSNSEYVLDRISVPCDYRLSNPLPEDALTPDPIDLVFSAYPDQVITDLVLVNQTYLETPHLKGQARFTQDIQNYFVLPNGETITIDSLFKFNGWSPTIHKDYTYDNFNRVYENYQVFSEQVLTYLALLPFMELVESKFKQLIGQFIPIVINISKFGRLVRQLERQKVRYPNIHKICAGSFVGCASRGSFRIAHGSNNGYSNTNNNLTIQIYSPSFTLVEDLGTINWTSTNSITATTVYNTITGNYASNEIAVTVNQNVVTIDIDYNWFLNTYSLNVNDCTLVVTGNGNVQIDNVFGLTGGVPSNITSGCFTVTVLNNTTVASGFPEEYVYYGAENALDTYVYFETELGGPGPYLYI